MAAEVVMSAISEVARSMNLVMKEKQLEAMATFISGRDVFVSLPTGYGKSLIFALLPLVFDIIKGMIHITSSSCSRLGGTSTS